MSILSFFLPASLRPPAKYPAVKPPKKASALLLLAADCLRGAMDTGRYVYDPDFWHHPAHRFTGPCAGSLVEAGVEGAKPVVLAEPGKHYIFVPPAGGVDTRTRIDLSGAIMAMRLGADPARSFKPGDFGWRWERRFKALNHLQRGMTRLASLQWDACHVPGVGEEDPPRFADSPQEFYRFLLRYSQEFFRHRA